MSELTKEELQKWAFCWRNNCSEVSDSCNACLSIDICEKASSQISKLIKQRPKLTKKEVEELGEKLFQKAMSSEVFSPCVAVTFIAEKLGFKID